MLSLLYTASKGLLPFLITIFLPCVLALPRDNGAAKPAPGRRTLLSCTFEVAERTFDLCPLVGRQVYAVEELYPAAGQASSPTASSPSTSAALRGNEEEEEGVGESLRVPVRIPLTLGSGSLQYKTVKGRKRPCTCLWDDNCQALDLLYVPGGAHSTASTISFICDTSLPNLGSLSYSTNVEGLYNFLWRTRHACPTAKGSSLTASGRISVAEEESKSPDENGDPRPEGDTDLLKPHRPSWRTSRKWIAGFLGVFAFAITFSLVLASSPRARYLVLQKIRSLLSSLLSTGSKAAKALGPLKQALASLLPVSLHLPFTFRQGDSRLVQWAEEDMGLQEDFVNGSGTYESQLDGEEWNGNNLDEYIPLNISPGKWGRKVRSYGSTPLRETFSVYAPQ